ncbi:TetR/AcrR family transcriptional regulator [Planctomicrobium sp. SH661]|uniref:TetR/AcrR family transcriptional regulator n=1 Tax=Planctomicrobium sp. SH661 TaxID=3448124 RepID=UPI003F5AEA69
MTTTDSTKRQPAETRHKLLEVSATILVEKGMAGFTLDLVAKAAGVSKGGLLHHFPSKQHLIDALVIDLHEQFLEHWRRAVSEDPVEAGRLTRAYLRVATQRSEEPSSRLCKIIAVEDRQNATMRSLWRNFLTNLIHSTQPGGADPISLAIVQLATDGLWLAEMEGILDGTSQLFTSIVQRLEEMTRTVSPDVRA